MAFMGWILLLLPAMALYALVSKIVTPFIGPFKPLLDWVTNPEVFYILLKLLLAVNVVILLVLLIVRHRLKRAGRLSRAYIHSVRGLRFLWRELVRLLLLLWPVWEVVVIAFCAAGLIVRPVSCYTVETPKTSQPFVGDWLVGPCVAVSPLCSLSQDEIDACEGLVCAYETEQYEKDGTTCLEIRTLISNGASWPVEHVHYTSVLAEEFEEAFQFPMTELGYESSVIGHGTLELSGGAGAVIGQEVFSGGGQAWLCWQGAFFQMEPANSP